MVKFAPWKPTSKAAPFWPPVHRLSDVLARFPPGVWAMVGFPGHDGSPGAPKLKITLYCAWRGASPTRTSARGSKRVVTMEFSAAREAVSAWLWIEDANLLAGRCRGGLSPHATEGKKWDADAATKRCTV